MEKELKSKICEQIEKEITNIVEEGIQVENIPMLGKLVDIHKDLANEEYWKNKEEVIKMNYRTGHPIYGNYGRDEYGRNEYGARQRDSRGRYMGRGRGYRGEEMLEEMMNNYETYMDGGNYNGETDKAFDYMLQSAEDFMMHLFDESNSPEQIEKIKRTARKISEMR